MLRFIGLYNICWLYYICRVQKSYVILFLFLTLKVSMAGAVSQYFSGSDCCKSKVEIECTDDQPSSEDEDKDCCDYLNCDCLCCAHTILNPSKFLLKISSAEDVYHLSFSYNNNYKLLFQHLVWHPPKQV